MSVARRTERRKIGDGDQQGIARGVTEGVVDELEVVEVRTNSTIGTVPLGSRDSSRDTTSWVNSERLASPVSGSCDAW